MPFTLKLSRWLEIARHVPLLVAGIALLAGCTPGSHRVLAQAISADLADTASVTIGGESATVTAINHSPASQTLQTGATQSLTASAQLSDGSSGPADVTYSATGGTITDAGAYTAGATAGTFRVIARQSGGTLADTSVVTVTASAPPPSSPPPPTSGKTFFSADGESGTLSPWSFSGSRPGADCSTNPCPSNSATRAKNGARSYKLEVTDPSADGHSTYLHTYYPQTSMGSPNGRYISGYYSGWYYIDAGFEATGRGQNGWTWNMALGWMAAAAINGNPDPISHIGFEVWDGVLQVVYVLKNAEVGNYPAPAIAGYRREGRGGIYRMTAQSPNGITGLSRGRWVHLAVYYKMARTNGQVTIWQDGVKIMDLTAPTMNTMDGHVTMTSPKQDMVIQANIYEGIKSGTQRYYLDDFKVTDYQVVP
jgi:hypothetical protein